jgi:hypothetical protein
MGWEQLVIGLAWPVVALVAVLLLRRPLGHLIRHVRKVQVGPANIDIATTVEARATALGRSPIDPDDVLEGLEISERVAEAGGSGPLASEIIAKRLESAVEGDEAARRDNVKELVRAAIEFGWSIGQSGAGQPTATLQWDSNGHAHLATGWWYPPEDSTEAALRTLRTPGMGGG